MYFHAKQLRSELIVDGEDVVGLDLLGLGIFREDALGDLAQGQRLDGTHQVPLRDIRLVLDLLDISTKAPIGSSLAIKIYVSGKSICTIFML